MILPRPSNPSSVSGRLVWHFLAGAVASLAVPPLFLIPAIFALSIPMIGYLNASGRIAAAAIWMAAGSGWFLASTYWVAHALIIDNPGLWFLMPLMAAALAAGLALFWAAGAALSWSLGRTALGRSFWLVVMLGLAEWSRGFVATGFPWNMPGSLFAVDVASLQAASLFGAYGLTMLALLLAMVPAFWAVGGRRVAVIWLLVPFGLVGAGIWRLEHAPPIIQQLAGDSRPVVRLVQPAIPQTEKWDPTKRADHLARLVGLSRDKTPIPDLVIWPETAFAGFPGREPDLVAGLARQATADRGFLLMGAPRLEPGRRLLNGAILYAHDGTHAGSYDKRHLVPFGEYIPFRQLFPFVSAFAGPIDFSSGQNNRLLPFGDNRRMQLLICYEVIFSGRVIDQAARPDVMVNLTNDAWFGDSAGPWQHLFHAQMRTVEEGVPLLRVANTGISAGFDGYGRPLGVLPLGAVGALDLRVPPALHPTIFSQFGNLAFFGLLVLNIGVALWLDLSRRIRQ